MLCQCLISAWKFGAAFESLDSCSFEAAAACESNRLACGKPSSSVPSTSSTEQKGDPCPPFRRHEEKENEEEMKDEGNRCAQKDGENTKRSAQLIG